MTEQADLLFELGTEELPPTALHKLMMALAEGFVTGLAEADLAHGEVVPYATPRRLAVLIRNVQFRQADRVEQRRGPAWQAAFDTAGEPTQAALGFARSCGLEVSQMSELKTSKGHWLQAEIALPGQTSAALLPKIAEQALRQLPIPKRMRWGASETQFVRPVHWLLFMHGQSVVDCTLLDLVAGRTTRGHRFHQPEPIQINVPADYACILETEGRVIACFATRRARIQQQVTAVAAELDAVAAMEPALLDEVTALNEWPVAISGSFESGFLQVPSEALVSAMQQHQKYFPVFDREGRLLPHFITVANIASRDPEVIRAGNERVMRPRLADAQYFWQQDGQQRLEDRQSKLQKVVFQQQLGSLAEKTTRVAALAEMIAIQIGGDPAIARRAAELSRCDLLTQMVQEFASLQGVMGRYLAQRDGEPAELAQAMEEFYQPRFAGDQLPQTKTGIAIALAERLDTLVGIFGIGKSPTGEKDPFGLRRAALGALRIMREQQLPLKLTDLLHAAQTGLAGRLTTPEVVETVETYMMQRLQGMYRDEGISKACFMAVVAVKPETLVDFEQRIQAIQAFAAQPEAAQLAAVHKRITQVLKKRSEVEAVPVDQALLQEPAEQQLYAQLQQTVQALEPLAYDYQAMLTELAQMHAPVDAFFAEVLVMAEDSAVRHNRLALLRKAADLFLHVADLSVGYR